VTLNGATAFPVDRLGIGVRNVLEGKSTKEFWCPGSTLKATFRQHEPAWLRNAVPWARALFEQPGFEITAQNAENYEAIAGTKIATCWRAAGWWVKRISRAERRW
jgi:hypothetical protein